MNNDNRVEKLFRLTAALEEASKCRVCGMGKEEARGYRSCEKCGAKMETAIRGTKEQWDKLGIKKSNLEREMNAEERNKSK